MTVRRYSAGVQRAKGLLELAAAMYDSSLSSESWRAAEGVLQTESRVGRALKLSLAGKPNDRRETSLSFVTGGVREIEAVADGKFSLAWVNPSVLLTMACRGKGPFRKKLPLRALAVFPSYDVMGFAVRESTGITSLSQIKKDRIPLRLSTRVVTKSALRENSTMFTVAAVMEAAGFTFAELRKWGGKIHLASRPSDPVRRESIEKSTVNAIFDEGIKSWARTALENGFRFLPIEKGVLRRMVALGYRPTAMTQSRFAGMAEDVTTVDFSGE